MLNTFDNSWIPKLLAAKKPVIFVGNGIRLAHAEQQLNNLLNKLHIPILITWRSMDLFQENHPLYVGRPGMIGQRGANITLQTCDFLLCLGTRLDLASVAFNYGDFAPNAVKIIVDIDDAEIDKLDFDKVGICDDVFSFLCKFNKYLNDNDITYRNDEWLQKCKKLHSQPIETIKSDTLSLYQFIEYLTPYLKNQVIVVGSSGTISEVFCQSLKVPSGCRVIQSNGLGSMGFGIPAAIGAYYASGKPIVCLDGDGSFAMNIQELGLVSELDLPIKFFIINNGGYVSIKNTQNNLCGGRLTGVDNSHGLFLPDYKELSYAYNIAYSSIRISNGFNIDTIIQNCLSNHFPRICEVFTDPNHKTQCRTTTIKQADGSLKASGLGNL